MLEDIDKMNFEEAIRKLEEIVQKMETEELSLDESLQCYQEGTKLVHHCRKLLTEAEFKVEQITGNDNSINFEMEDKNGYHQT